MARDYPDQTRNLNPTPEAVVAQIMFGADYAKQGGGVTDFWDGLSADKKRRCEIVANEWGGSINKAMALHDSPASRKVRALAAKEPGE